MNASLFKGDAVEESMSQETEAINAVAETTSLNSVIMKKVGMTRIFDSNGNHIPVTVLSLEKAKIVQIKNNDSDGYTSVKFAYSLKREKLINSPLRGELKKANIDDSFSMLTETSISAEDAQSLQVGSEVKLADCNPGELINITGLTKGKGFAGVVKRYGFAGGPKSHGSKFHRTTGSIGNRATPGKVWKGKKMPGHMGAKKQTVKNLEIVELNNEKGYLLVKGSVPGSKNSFVRVTKA